MPAWPQPFELLWRAFHFVHLRLLALVCCHNGSPRFLSAEQKTLAKTAAELAPARKNKLSHRGKALGRMIALLREVS